MSAFIDPSRAQFDAFKALDRDRPLDMLNLVALRPQAAYQEGHALADAGLSGQDAYARYGAETAPILARVGGKIAWRGRFDVTLIGPPEERWDIMFVARYPSAHAFLAMVSDAEYQRAVVHRQAGVRSSRLIRSEALAGQEQFG